MKSITKKDVKRLDELYKLKETVRKNADPTFVQKSIDPIDKLINSILSKYDVKPKWSTEVDQKH